MKYSIFKCLLPTLLAILFFALYWRETTLHQQALEDLAEAHAICGELIRELGRLNDALERFEPIPVVPLRTDGTLPGLPGLGLAP